LAACERQVFGRLLQLYNSQVHHLLRSVLYSINCHNESKPQHASNTNNKMCGGGIERGARVAIPLFYASFQSHLIMYRAGRKKPLKSIRRLRFPSLHWCDSDAPSFMRSGWTQHMRNSSTVCCATISKKY